MKLSVIIPTIGRDTLAAAVQSCEGADEIIVVADNCRSPVETRLLPLPVRWANVMGGDHGYTARTRGIELATGTHLAFMDDDDRYTAGAIQTIKRTECDWPVIFKMRHPQHGVLWRNQTLEFGNVGTPMFVVPNDPARLGKWDPFAPGLPEPGGDFTFISGCVEKVGRVEWRDEIIATVKPGPTVTIVTPWLNHRELEDDYWAAVAGVDAQVLVIDNGSDPPLPNAWRLDTNTGFSHACNVGLQLAQTDAVLFLNNDIAPLAHDWLQSLVEALEPGVLVGACLRYDQHGSVDGEPLPYLDGWCLAGMRQDLLNLGGWDETYLEPSYYGDNDLSLRARAAGMTLREVRVALHHKNGGTHNGDDQHRQKVTELNRARFAALAAQLLGGDDGD